MGTAITAGTISVDGTSFEQDKQTLTLTAAATTSTVFSIGKMQSRGEILLKAVTDIVVAAANTLKVELLEDIASDGSFAKVTLLETFAPGTLSGTFLKWVSNDDTLCYGKIKITPSEDQTGEFVTLDFRRLV